MKTTAFAILTTASLCSFGFSQNSGKSGQNTRSGSEVGALTENLESHVVTFNALLLPPENKNAGSAKRIQVIVDLRPLSSIVLFTHISVSVDVIHNGKKVRTLTLPFPLDKSGAVQAGKKITHTFQLNDPTLSLPGISIRPGSFTGGTEKNWYAYQEKPLDGTHGIT